MTTCDLCGHADGTHDPSGLCAAKARRDDGMARAEANALESWKAEAFAAVERYLRSHETLFCDDLAPFLPALPADRRALGPVFMRAAREGLMVRTNEYRASAASNCSPKVVWRSLIYAGRSAA